MIIDEILERKESKVYMANDFYNYCIQCDLSISEDITRAMDCGTEEDIKEALCQYIICNNYNTDICDFIRSVDWLEEEREEGFYGYMTVGVDENDDYIYETQVVTSDLDIALGCYDEVEKVEHVVRVITYECFISTESDKVELIDVI